VDVEIALAALCIVVSALFTGTEVAMFALRRVDREQMARSARGADKQVLAMLQHPRRLIATVLIGNETINCVLSILALMLVGTWLELPSRWAQGAVAIALLMPVVVLLGEVTPKSLALKSPLTWARRAAAPLRLFSYVVAPARWVIVGLVETLLRPLGAPPSPSERDLSEEEFRRLIDTGSAQGQVDARERRLIHKVFEFSDKNVGQIMTPRDRVFALSYDLPTARLLKEVAARGFSRVPIYQKSLDNVRGILNAKDLLRPSPGPSRSTLGELLHEPLFVPRTTPIKRVFLTFKQRKVHMAIVVNEYGKVLGLVTMDDVLAQLFGTLRDEREGIQAAGRRGRGGRTPAGGAVANAVADVVADAPASAGEEPGEPGLELAPARDVGHLESGEGVAEGEARFLDAIAEAPARARKSGRVEVHEEVTPPATDVAELAADALTSDALAATHEPEWSDPDADPPMRRRARTSGLRRRAIQSQWELSAELGEASDAAGTEAADQATAETGEAGPASQASDAETGGGSDAAPDGGDGGDAAEAAAAVDAASSRPRRPSS
jgi:putative hemolysin